MSTPSRRRLLELFKARAVSFGHFTLASGKESTYYINSKKALFHSEAVALLGEALFDLTHDLDVQAVGGLDITLEAFLLTGKMRVRGDAPFRLSRSSFAHVYWTVAQMVAHHASNGCNLEIGDLMGSGTVSGPEPDSRASLLELTKGGREPLALPDGETRRFIEDGDEIIFRGHCEREGFARIGFGECRAVIEPAQ